MKHVLPRLRKPHTPRIDGMACSDTNKPPLGVWSWCGARGDTSCRLLNRGDRGPPSSWTGHRAVSSSGRPMSPPATSSGSSPPRSVSGDRVQKSGRSWTHSVRAAGEGAAGALHEMAVAPQLEVDGRDKSIPLTGTN